MKCPKCKSDNLVKAGKAWRDSKKIQRWRCGSCGKLFSEPRKIKENK